MAHHGSSRTAEKGGYALGSFIADTAENKEALARVEAQLKQMNHRFEKVSGLIEEQKARENDEK